jgi:hypothetical protein
MPTRSGDAPVRVEKGGSEERPVEASRACTEKKKVAIARLDSMGVDHDDVDDLAVPRQMVAHHLHLGVSPEGRWSGAQIPRAVNEVLKLSASPALMGSGKSARSFSRQELSADGDDSARKRGRRQKMGSSQLLAVRRASARPASCRGARALVLHPRARSLGRRVRPRGPCLDGVSPSGPLSHQSRECCEDQGVARTGANEQDPPLGLEQLPKRCWPIKVRGVG